MQLNYCKENDINEYFVADVVKKALRLGDASKV
jgi:hypothetical protein